MKTPKMWIYLKNILKKTPFYLPIRSWWYLLDFNRRRILEEINSTTLQWEGEGRPIPPPRQVKSGVLLRYAYRYKVKVFIETGTAYGATTQSMSPYFQKIYSIELNPDFHKKNLEKFKFYRHINLLLGDSGEKLVEVLNCLSEPALFWLDAHYSGGDTARGDKDTPILDELKHIFNSPFNHIILIDDARCFGTDPAYPTIDELRTFICQHRRNYQLKVVDDIIRLTPES